MDMDACASLKAMRELISKLTGPDGCPWDREQTPRTLADYVIEESHELAAAIRSDDIRNLMEELGDVAFLLVFIADYCEKKGWFSLADALGNNTAKMIRRHPHVFANASFASQSEQLQAWEAIKKKEHRDSPGGLFASLPESLPALVKAYRIHSKAARAGFTWPEDGEVEQQAESEWLEWLDVSKGEDNEAQTHELGDMLFTLVEIGRRKGIKANEALDLACRRFLRRYATMEALAAQAGHDLDTLSLDEKDELWNEAKAREGK